jgi:hypothetical protein
MMPVRPSRLWKDMPLENRLLAADAFWRDDQAEAGMQHVEAVVSIARRLNFRPKSVQALSLEKRAKHLAHMQDVSDAVATRALIAYHFAARKDLMAAFLDALGISHEDGLIKEESVPPPPREKLAAAIAAVRGSFPAADVDLYVRTLASLDGETWAEAEAALAASE